MHSSKYYFSRITSIDLLFSIGIYITIGAACISNLRMTLIGPSINIEGGSPFLYEIGIAIILAATFLKFMHGIQRLDFCRKLVLIGLSFFYVPIFLVFLLKSADTKQLIGGGQLRLQLEVWLLGTALVFYPINGNIIRNALLVVIFMVFANGLHAIASYLGIVEPLYINAWRIAGEYRYSGFLDMPGRLGVICAIAIAWALWVAPNRIVAFAVIIVCGFAIIVADSRTGMVASVVGISAKVISPRKISRISKILLIFLLVMLSAIAIFFVPAITWIEDITRIESIRVAVEIWLENPFGIAWGTFEQFNSSMLAVSPHNWPAISLLYGGVFSFLAVIAAHVWTFRIYLARYDSRSDEDRLIMGLVLIMIVVTTASWVEQVLQEASSALIYVFALTSLTHRIGLQRRTKKIQAFQANFQISRRTAIDCNRPY